MRDQQSAVDSVIKAHAQKARRIEPDRSVATTTVRDAREIALSVPQDLPHAEYALTLLNGLDGLVTRCHDLDGQAMLKHAVIVALVDDVRLALKNCSR